MSAATTFIIIPAYNEQEVLRHTVASLLDFGYTVVVVDDGSEQPQELTGLPVHLLRHRVNLGQGAALQTGMDYALQQGAAFLVHFDADGQHRARDIEALLHPLRSGTYAVSLGSRFLQEQNEIPLKKRMVILAARILNFLFTGLWLTDAHNGLRAFNQEAARLIRITENRMAHASEILFLIKQQKLRFTEVAVVVTYSSYARKKGQSVWNSIRIFFDLLLHKLFQ